MDPLAELKLEIETIKSRLALIENAVREFDSLRDALQVRVGMLENGMRMGSGSFRVKQIETALAKANIVIEAEPAPVEPTPNPA